MKSKTNLAVAEILESLAIIDHEEALKNFRQVSKSVNDNLPYSQKFVDSLLILAVAQKKLIEAKNNTAKYARQYIADCRIIDLYNWIHS